MAWLLRLGFVANFISTPVLTGFKAGIGLVIVLDQIPKLLGIHITKEGFFRDVLSVAQHVPETSLITLAVAVATLRRADRHGAAVAALAGTAGRGGGGIAASWFFGLKALGVSTVGLIPQGLPSITLPDPRSDRSNLLPGALGIALMSFTETIAAGRAFARPTTRRSIRIANCWPPAPPIWAARCFGAMPAGGGTSQTAVVRSAGGTQKASLVTAAAALATMLLLAPILGLLPNATLAAVVIVYSVGLIQPAEFRAIRRVRTMEFRWALDRVRRCVACSAR